MAERDTKRERQQRIVLQFMLAFWALLASVVFFLSPHMRAATRDRRAALELLDKVERAQQLSKVQDTVFDRVKGWGTTIDEIEGLMLAGDAFNYLVKEISAIARGLDVEVVSIRPDYARTNRPREDLPYVDARSVLEVVAPFNAMGELVASLERLSPMLSVELIEVTAGAPPRHRAKLELSLLYVPEQSEGEGEEQQQQAKADRGAGRTAEK